MCRHSEYGLSGEKVSISINVGRNEDECSCRRRKRVGCMSVFRAATPAAHSTFDYRACNRSEKSRLKQKVETW